MPNSRRNNREHGYTLHNTRNNSLLWRLAEHSELLTRLDNNRVRIVEQIETPYDEYGIIDRPQLFKRIMGSVASEYHWEGSYAGPHHLMWPRCNYGQRAFSGNVADLTAQFRGSPSLKVILPREMHDYLHKVTEPPKAPDFDVMRQYNIEQSQVQRLYNGVRRDSFADLYVSFEDKEFLRAKYLSRKLDEMKDGQLGLMPDRETLATSSLAKVRDILRHKARPLGISPAKSCQRIFNTEY